MHGYSSARAERAHPNVFWGKSKSGRAHLLVPSPDERDDIQGADQVDTLSGRIVAAWGSGFASMFLQAEEDVNA